MAPNKPTAWHTLTPEQAISSLDSSLQGLSQHEYKRRLAQYGPNTLTPKKTSWIKRVIEPFTSLFVVVLLVAIVISLFTHEKLDAIIIGVVVVINALIFYFQQYSVNKVLKTLKSQEEGDVTIQRDGKTLKVSSHELVPGDIVYIFEGTKVPADGRLLEINNIQADESMLTGESLPVHKTIDTLPEKTEIYDQKNMVFKGSFIKAGGGRYVITTTGNNTELGTITTLASSGDIGKTPIEKKIDGITRFMVGSIGFVGIGVFGLALLRGISSAEALRFSISLVVSIVPEGLPVTLTVVLLLSAKKMASHKALVKKLSSIETMGAITLIATDKTGTLTKNKLQVADTYDATGHLEKTASHSITMQNGVVTDPLDSVLLGGFAAGKSVKHTQDFPFDNEQRVSGAIVTENGRKNLYVKGAPEVFLKDMKKNEQFKAKEALDEYTKKGYRTIGCGHIAATTSIESIKPEHIKKLKFDGFIAFADPIRNGIPDAIEDAHEAGIKVVMLTGDHTNTAAEIGRQAGLVTNAQQVASSELLEKPRTAKSMKTILERIKVFGRVLPKHKFNFLRSVKKTEITAMTGDGVNDIPALVEADAGLAMGSGTDAAKDASDIVLLDDNFVTIVDAIRQGRAVIANIRKMLFYLISTSIGEAGAMIGALLFNLPLPVTAVQILWMNIVTDGFTVLPLGLSDPEPHQMKRPPHKPDAPLLSRVLATRTVLSGLVMAAVGLFFFNKLLPQGYAYAQTATFLSLVVGQWVNALNANFERASWVKNITKPNWKLYAGILLSIAFQLFAMYGPLRDAFGVVSLSASDIVTITIVSSLATLVAVDIHKLAVHYMKR